MKSDEGWQLPVRPEPVATRKDYYVLLAVVGLVFLTAVSCCGIGFYAGKAVFG